MTRRDDVRPALHFLHLPKTGGTAIHAALRDAGPVRGRALVLHDHDATARSIPVEDEYFFVVRDPASRFVSAFYSRQCRGRPRYDFAWTPEEALLFERFSTADELAGALGSPDADDRAAAERAMRAVPHFRPMHHWVGRAAELQRDAGRVFAVLSQSSLDDDFAALARRLGLSTRLPAGDVEAHRNPATVLDACRGLTSWSGEESRLRPRTVQETPDNEGEP